MGWAPDDGYASDISWKITDVYGNIILDKPRDTTPPYLTIGTFTIQKTFTRT